MKTFAIGLLVSVLVIGAGATAGDSPNKSYGLHGGFGLTPDQAVFGVQSELGRVKMARFAPSVDFGFGDNVTTIALNADVRLHISPPKSGSAIYIGGGPTLAVINPKGPVGSDTEIGLSLTGGLKVPMGANNAYTLEGRLGLGDIPDFRLLIGVLFGGQGRTSAK